MTECGDEENRFAEQVKKYRENPEESDKASSSDGKGSDDDDSDSDSDSSDSDAKAKTKKKEVKAKKPKDSSSSDEDSSSDSDSSSSDSDSEESGSGSDSDDVSEKSDDIKEEETEPGSLPKKYAFLALKREEMTAEQRRFKWMKYEFLPDDMKPFFTDPNAKTQKV